jgi:hypothetical protein
MDNESAPEAGQTGYLKLPWLLVAGALIVLLGGALAVGLMANRSLREQVALPTPTAAALAAAPTATRVRATATSPPATATPVPQVTPTSVATATPEPTLAPSPRPTVDPALADEVSQAYLHYWDVRADALLNLDDSELPEVMGGDHLASAEKLIQQLRAEGHAIQTDVKHNFAVLDASTNHAEVVDIYEDNSMYVDPQSHRPIGAPVSDNLKELYVMDKIDGG